jgi:curli production assembly/transport component CsgG
MMIPKSAKFFWFALTLCVASVQAQREQDSLRVDNSFKFFDLRGTNVADLGLGGSTLFGDYEDKSFGFYYRVGYKRYITPNIFVGLTANGYTIGAEDTDFNLMSFDFSMELLLLPYDRFSPIVYGGFGINTSSDVDANAVKTQIGIGVEYMVVEQVGIKLYYEYNYSFEDELQPLIVDDRNDKFLRFGLGLNFYFGGTQEREKRVQEMETIINSNLLDN